MTNEMFLLFRTLFITLMTVGMMASLTDFRFGRRKLLLVLAIYSIWVSCSSLVLLRFGGELLLLRLFISRFLFQPSCLPTGPPTTPPPRQCSTTRRRSWCLHCRPL